MEEEIHLLDYLEVIKRRKWIVIACLVCILTSVGLGTYLTQPVYQATAKLKVGKERGISSMLGRGVDYWETDYSESLTYKTHSEMIKSLPVLYLAAKELKLDELEEKGREPTFKEEIRRNLGKIKSWFFSLFSLLSPKEPQKERLLPDDPYIMWANALKGEVSIAPIRDTRLIAVSVRDIDPVFCRDAANVICESYINYLGKSRLDSFKNYLSFFSSELSKMKEKLEESENRFYQFRQKEKIFSLDQKRGISARDISSLSAELIRTRVERSGLEEKVNELEGVLKKGKIEEFSPAILDNQILFELKADLVKAIIEQEELKRTYKEKHPVIIESKARIKKIKEYFNRELIKTIDALKQEISILKRKENRIASQMKDKESEDLSLSGKELQYAILEREVTTNKELYEALLTNFKEMEVLKGIGEDEVRLVEKAQLPLAPIKPKPFLNMVLALFTGLALGVGLSFFLEYMDRSIKDEKQVERHLKLPVLSLVPKREEVIIREEITGEMVESFQNLSTNLKFQALNKPMKILLVTSPGVEEGKTTVVRNLGITLAWSNDKVLMIDADLKFPSLGKSLTHNGNGLTELLKEFPSFEKNGWFNEEFSFSDVQRLIFAEGKSGVMTILKGEKQFQALFDQGRLVDLCWRNRPPERRLGQILLRNKAIEEETLKDALELAQSAKRRMGSVLLSLHSVPPERVEKLLDLHLSETISLLYSDKNGKYEFREMKVEKDSLIFSALLEKFHLQGDSPWLEKKIKNYLVDTGVENLMFLPSGSPIQNPLPLIASRRFEVILSVLKDIFDYILLDSPPIFLADAVTLSQYSDGNLLVFMAGRTRPENAKKALDILNGAGSYIAGVILNGMEMKKHIDYYYGKYYGNARG